MSVLLLIDSFARGGTLALLALWSWLLLRDHRAALAARVAVSMNLAIACHVLTTIPAGGFSRSADILLDIVSLTVPPLFWLFARAWFADEQRIGWAGWAAVPAMVLIALVHRTTPDGGLAFWISGIALRSAMFGFAAAGLWIAWRGREGDLVEARRRLRWRLVMAVGVFVILTNLVEVLVGFGLLGAFWRSLIEIGVTLLILVFCIAMFGVRQDDLLGPPQRRPAVAAPAAAVDEVLAAHLHDYMAAHKPWRDETLTIAALAARLGEQEYRLRRLINRALGHRNFAQFLNGYRLAEVRAALADPAQAEVPILTIALDAGFGSLGPFNRAFREAEGTTPSAWRARALADSGIG